MRERVCSSPLHVAVLTSQAVSPAEPGRMWECVSKKHESPPNHRRGVPSAWPTRIAVGLADKVVVKYFSNFKNSCIFAFRKNGFITTKSKHDDN